MKSDPILLVSDGSHDMTQLIRNLQIAGHAIEPNINPELGRQLVKQTKTALLLLGLGTPQLASNYYQSLLKDAEIADFFPPQAIVLCTAKYAADAAKLALDHQVFDYYIFDPIYDPNRLYLCIQQALDCGKMQIKVDALTEELSQSRAQLKTAEESLRQMLQKNTQLQEESAQSHDRLRQGVEEGLLQFEERMLSTGLNGALKVTDPTKLRGHFSDLNEKEIRQHFEACKEHATHSHQALLKELQGHEHSLPTASILIIDDDPKSLRLLQAMLKSAGQIVRCAGNTKQAVAIALKTRPDLILMDVMMPNVNGIELTRRFKAHPQLKEIAIVIVTAHASKEVIQRSAEAGASDFITKPVRLPVLLEKIRPFCPDYGTSQ